MDTSASKPAKKFALKLTKALRDFTLRKLRLKKVQREYMIQMKCTPTKLRHSVWLWSAKFLSVKGKSGSLSALDGSGHMPNHFFAKS
jgi:hypothetical protein